MRPTDLRERLNRLADLVSEKDPERKRVLENVDLIAQGALEAEMTYVNKKGDAVTVEAPQWAIALKAQQVAAGILGISEADAKKAATGTPGTEPVVAAILKVVGQK